MSSKYSMLYEDEASAPGPSPTIAPLPLRTSKYASLYEDDESLVEASEPEPTPTPEPQQPQATPNTFGSYPSAIDYKAVGKGLSEAFGKPRIDATTGAGTTTKPYRASQGTFGTYNPQESGQEPTPDLIGSLLELVGEYGKAAVTNPLTTAKGALNATPYMGGTMSMGGAPMAGYKGDKDIDKYAGLEKERQEYIKTLPEDEQMAYGTGQFVGKLGKGLALGSGMGPVKSLGQAVSRGFMENTPFIADAVKEGTIGPEIGFNTLIDMATHGGSKLIKPIFKGLGKGAGKGASNFYSPKEAGQYLSNTGKEGVDKILNFFRKNTDADQFTGLAKPKDVKQLANEAAGRAGIPLTRAQETSELGEIRPTGALAAIEEMASGWGGRGTMRKFKQEQENAVKRGLTDLFGGSSPEYDDIAREVTGSLEGGLKRIDDKLGEGYNLVRKSGNQADINTRELTEAVRADLPEIFMDKSGARLPKDVPSGLDKNIENEIADWVTQIGNIDKSPVADKYKLFRDLKTKIGGKGYERELGLNEKKAYKVLYNKMLDAERAHLQALPGGTELVNTLDMLNEFYAGTIDLRNMTSKMIGVGKELGQKGYVNPGKALDKLLNPKEFDRLQRLMPLLDEEGKKHLRAGLITKMFQNVQNTSGVISQAKMSSMMKKYPKSMMDEVLGKESVDKLSDTFIGMQRARMNEITLDTPANPSQTGMKFGDLISGVGGAGAVIGGVFSQHKGLGAAFGLGIAGKEYLSNLAARISTRGGFAFERLAGSTLGGGAVGGTIGAVTNPEDRKGGFIKGAQIGAGVGLTGGLAWPLLGRIGKKTITDGIDNANKLIPNQSGTISPDLINTLTRTGGGGVAGGTIGANIGDTPEERQQNALAGLLLGAMGANAPQLARGARRLGNKGQIDVWHGSPHKFDKFQMDKLGTGEGAQAFGHGLYFTDQKDIAEHYAQALGGNKRADKLKEVIQNSGNEIPAFKNKYPEAVLKLDGDGDIVFHNKNLNKTAKATIDDIKDALENNVKSSESLYKATLHKGKKPSEYDYLRWDKPLKDAQFDKAIKHAEEIGTKQTADQLRELKDLGVSGEYTYKSLVSSYGSPEQTSDFLLRAGIDGIDYPAGSLSGGGKGRNYVVFDENAVSIDDVSQLGGVDPSLLGAMGRATTGGVVGGTIGATQGETPEQKALNAMLGAFGGAGLATGLGSKAGRRMLKGQEGAVKLGKTTDNPNFKKWSNNSPVINIGQAKYYKFKTGKPVVVEALHGSDRQIKAFSDAELGSNTGARSARKGHFFTDSESNAEYYPAYPKNVMNDELKNTILPKKEFIVNKEESKRLGYNVGKSIETAPPKYDIKKLQDETLSIVNSISDKVDEDYTSSQVYAILKNGKVNETIRYNKNIPYKTRLEIESLAKKYDENKTVLTDLEKMGNRHKYSNRKLAGGDEDGAWDGVNYSLSPNVSKNYVKMDNPYVHDYKGVGYRDVSYNDILTKAKSEGYDGVILLNTKDPYEGNIFVAFKPTQIKSATGNTGAFDPTNPDITKALLPLILGSGAMAGANNNK